MGTRSLRFRALATEWRNGSLCMRARNGKTGADGVAIPRSERKTKLAPEQEPLSALYWNVPRSELSMAAELEAARHAWEGSRAYGAARPVTGDEIRDTTF